MQVAPSATYEAVIDWGATGATLGMTVVDNAGAVSVARVTGFTEYPAGSGVYYLGGNTAPGTGGQYTLIYDDDGGTQAVGHVATEELLVTSDPTVTISTSNLYVSQAELKALLNITTTAQDDEIDLARAAASRAVDNYTRTRFFPTTETRYYSPQRCDFELVIDDLNALTSLKVDPTGDGTWDETWTVATHFFLQPVNNPLEDKPYNTIKLNPLGGKVFPGYTNGVQIIGSFGWAETPSTVKQATAILATRLYQRRNSPMGILTVGGDTIAAMRLSRTDPDVAALLDSLDTKPPLLWL